MNKYPMRSLNSLIWRNLTANPLRSILTTLAITLGVGMVLAATVVGQAASQSAAELSDEGPRIDLEVFSRDRAPFDQGVLNVLRASPDVAQASPSLRVEVQGVRPAIPSLTLLGVEPDAYQALHEPELAGGTFLGRPDTIVLPVMVALNHNLHVDDEVTLSAGDRVVVLAIAGRLRTEADDLPIGQPPTAFVPLSTAQNLAATPGQIDCIKVALHPGVDLEQARADMVRAVGPDLAVVRAVAAQGVMGNVVLVQAGLAIVGLIILFAAAFVILNAFAMSVTGRTQEIGALRALGMRRSQVLRTVLAEAGLLGLLGTAAGLLVGVGLAWIVMGVMGTLGDARFAVPLWGLLLSTLMGLTVTLAAAMQPAWRASRVSPVVATRPQTTVASGWYVCIGGRVGAILLSLLLPGLAAFGLLVRPDFSTALPAVLLGQAALLGATTLLLPALVDPVTALCRPFLTRWLGTAGRLAVDNLARNKLRAVLTAGALTAGLTIVVATGGLMTAGLKGALSRIRAMDHEDGFVTADLAEVVASQEMTVDNFFQYLTQNDPGFELNPVVEALGPLAKSGVIEIERCCFRPIPPEASALPGAPGLFVDPEVYLDIGNFDFFEGDPKTALEWMQRGRAVLLTPIVAERLGVEVGDEIPLQTPHGEVPFTVAGVGGGGFMMTVLPYGDGETYFDVTEPSFLGIVVSEGQDVEATLAQVREAIKPFPRIMLHDYRSSLDPLLDMIDQLELLLDGLLLLAVVVAALGVVNTMVINVAERRREIGLLRAVGATQRQVRRAVVAEAATLGLLAALVACGLGLLMLMTYGLLILPNGTASLGVRPDWETIRLTMGAGLRDLGVAATISLAFGPLIAGLAAYYPARSAAAIEVVEATRSERVALKRTGIKRLEDPSRRRRGRARIVRSLSWALTWRNLDQARTRTVLSALAVALGVAMIVAASVASSGIRNASVVGENVMEWINDMIEVVLTIVGFVILVAAGFLIFNAFAMTVAQRRRQIGLLRALGMTRRQVLVQLLVEALVTGGLGTALGLVAGPLFGHVLLAVARQVGVEIGQGSISTTSLVLALVTGLGITLLSVMVPAWGATHISPLVALRQETTPSPARKPFGRAVVGLLMMLGLVTYLLVAPPGEWSGNHPPWEWIMPLLLALPWLAALTLTLPALIAGVAGGAGRMLTRLWGATGRLMADNLSRDRRRVTLTTLTFAVGLTVIVFFNGFLTFNNEVLVMEAAKGVMEQTTWFIYPFDRQNGLAQLDEFGGGMTRIKPTVQNDVYQLAAGRAHVSESYMVLVPDIGSPIPGFPSMILGLDSLTRTGSFSFTEGNWQTARPLMEAGCGLLLPPAVAARHRVGIGDQLTLQGLDGPVVCTVAGIGHGGTVAFSIISLAAKEAFVSGPPTALTVWPLPGTDVTALEADLRALETSHGGDVWVVTPKDEVQSILDTSDQLESTTYVLLALAVAAAAMGMVNTTVMSVTERRHELGMLRAVGATRRQVRCVVAGEAALIGLIGSGLGLVAGAGLTVIYGLSYGGIPFGLVDLDLWDGARQSVGPALLNGLLGILITPAVSAAAASLPVRSILRGSAIETMEPPRQETVSPRGAVVGLMKRGSIRTRFVLGTAALTLIVLAGLIGAVTAHERSYLEDVVGDTLLAFLEGQAGLIELNLPADAQRLSLLDLPVQQLDADAMLRFRALMEDIGAHGLETFTVADGDNVALLALDPRQIGTVLPNLERPAESKVAFERKAGEWRMDAAVPILNKGKLVIGSVRMTANLAQGQALLRKTRDTLWGVGGLVVAIALSLSWTLAMPMVRATRQLTARAARVAQGEYLPFDRPRRRWLASLIAKTSLRVRMTAAMVLIVLLLVGTLEIAVIPIERHHTESTLQDSMIAATGWMGQATSEALAEELVSTEPFDTAPDRDFTLDQMLSMARTMDWARLQELSEQTRSEDVAYVALVDKEGVIQLSDQVGLIGEAAPVPTKTQIEESHWRDEKVWVVSTPLRRGQNGEQVGALRIGVRRAGVEGFLDESRTLFRLAGLIALLAGTLLAQGVGGAVTAPVRRLAADTRRVGQGDLGVQFHVDTRDELALLASAFNQMVAGLREREWLRDMFGRFVSHEVAEALRTGQVRLEGENRVVSVLFCDIRGFTARSEGSTPEQMVALLNEYLPVVVEAAQRHTGTVNKFGGDSTLIIYGAPRPLQESAYQAVLTALEMRANLKALNERLAERGEMPIRIGVGINTGVALAGAVGPKERQEYTVIGDTVNLASRIEALNKEYPDYDILISGWTYEALGSRRREFELFDLGEVQIRGKADPVRVWTVIGLER